MSLFDLSTFKDWYLKERSTYAYVGKIFLRMDETALPESLTKNQFLKAARAYVNLLERIDKGQRPYEAWSMVEARKAFARRPSGEVLDLLAVEAGRWFASPYDHRACDEWTHWNEHFSGVEHEGFSYRVATTELVRYVREEIVMSGSVADE
jgi:hypothetical protein